MVNFIKKDWLALLLVITPFAYLGLIWDRLPERVPLHWNLQGEVDRWGAKTEMWLIPFLTTALIYVLLSVVPAIDPKKRISEMGVGYERLKLVIVAVMSALALVLIHMTQNEKMESPVPVLLLVGLLFAVLGGFMNRIKPNYFIGIRTPWTLESPEVWAKTHKLGGVLFILGGILIGGVSLLTRSEIAFQVTVFTGVAIALVSVAYSYWIYRKLS